MNECNVVGNTLLLQDLISKKISMCLYIKNFTTEIGYGTGSRQDAGEAAKRAEADNASTAEEHSSIHQTSPASSLA